MLADYDIDRIALGIVDGRNSLLEDVETILKKIHKYMDKREPEILYITPSCELEFLPIDIADEKVKLISRIVKRLI
jgi:methionine synthase II (cobalamin-independent)